MPRTGIAYRIDENWREAVEARLIELDWTRTQLADEAGCPKSLITELLNGERHQTTYLPEIHAALGFGPPQGPLLAPDQRQILDFWSHLDEQGRRRVIEAAHEQLSRLLKKDQDKKR